MKLINLPTKDIDKKIKDVFEVKDGFRMVQFPPTFPLISLFYELEQIFRWSAIFTESGTIDLATITVPPRIYLAIVPSPMSQHLDLTRS